MDTSRGGKSSRPSVDDHGLRRVRQARSVSPTSVVRSERQRGSVSIAAVTDLADRLQLVRGRQDRLPAEHLARSLAEQLREREHDASSRERWGELAAAFEVAAEDPLADDVGHAIELLRDYTARLVAESDVAPRE